MQLVSVIAGSAIDVLFRDHKVGSGRVTAYPEITPKMEFCPDGRQAYRNSESALECG
jgi:hypothetical protein